MAGMEGHVGMAMGNGGLQGMGRRLWTCTGPDGPSGTVGCGQNRD
jgi:hypothetical protein